MKSRDMTDSRRKSSENKLPIAIRSPDLRMARSVQRAHAVIDWVLEEQRRLSRKRYSRADMEAALGREFWRVVRAEWSGFDRIPHFEYQLLFNRFRPYWTMDSWEPETMASYAGLPERVIAFRGQSANNEVGLSFTTDFSVAKSFAEGHRGIAVSNPIVLEVEVNKTDIAFIATDRSEGELILFHPPSRSFCTQRRVS